MSTDNCKYCTIKCEDIEEAQSNGCDVLLVQHLQNKNIELTTVLDEMNKRLLYYIEHSTYLSCEVLGYRYRDGRYCCNFMAQDQELLNKVKKILG